VTPPPADEMYKQDFGGRAAWKGTAEKAEQPGSPTRTSSAPVSPATGKKMRSFVGPSSDMLAPVVSVTRVYDAAMLNHQSSALAKGWELGGWDLEFSDMFDNEEVETSLHSDEYEEGQAETPTGDLSESQKSR
jgi:hypothetical protein